MHDISATHGPMLNGGGTGQQRLSSNEQIRRGGTPDLFICIDMIVATTYSADQRQEDRAIRIRQIVIAIDREGAVPCHHSRHRC